jgi:hypothetical protein
MSSAVVSTVGAVVGIGNTLFGGSSSTAGNVAGSGGSLFSNWANYQPQFANQLVNLMNNPGQVTSMPGYQFGMQQGTQALNRSYAATGQQNSGAQAIGLQNYGQQYAGSMFQQQFNNLSALAGTGQQPTSVIGQNQLNASQQNLGLQQLASATGALSQTGLFGSNATPASMSNSLNYDSSGNYTGAGALAPSQNLDYYYNMSSMGGG